MGGWAGNPTGFRFKHEEHRVKLNLKSPYRPCISACLAQVQKLRSLGFQEDLSRHYIGVSMRFAGRTLSSRTGLGHRIKEIYPA